MNLKNIENLFKEKKFRKRILNKINNKLLKSKDKTWFKYCIKPFKYLPMSSTLYYSLFNAKEDFEEYGAERVVFKETLHIAYGTFGKIVIGGYLAMGISSGIWDPKEFWEKKLEPIVKPKKEIQKIPEKTSNFPTNCKYSFYAQSQ